MCPKNKSFFRFMLHGLKHDINSLLCKIVGHRLNNSPINHWCARCHRSYLDCFNDPNNEMREAERAVKELMKELNSK